MKKSSEAMTRAVKWLNDRGGYGVLDRYGRMLAEGEIGKHISPITWLRLTQRGYLGGSVILNRLELSEWGIALANGHAI